MKKHNKKSFWNAKHILTVFAVVLVWTLVLVSVAPSVYAATTSTFNVFQLSVDSSQKVEVTPTNTGWSVKLYGKTESGCTSSTNSTVDATLTVTNTGTKPDGSVRAVSFKITTTGAKTNDAGVAKTLDATTTSLSYTATSGNGSSAYTTVTIDFVDIVQEALGAQIITTVNPGTNGTVTVDGTPVTAAATFTNSDDHVYTLTATPAEGYEFFGWLVSGGDPLTVKGETTLAYYGTEEKTLTPQFVKEGSAAYVIKGASPVTYYGYLDEAISAAGSSGTVVVFKNGKAFASDGSTNFTIPSGVTLLIPFDDAYTVIKDNMKDYVHAPHTDHPAKVQHRSLTLPTSHTITVASGGSISVGSRAHNFMVGQTGSYGALYMDNGSHITIQDGANLYAWGYIFYGTGNGGTITVESGATVYENATIMDYTGDAGVANDLYDNGVMPLRAFSFINVEVPMTFEYGGKMNAFYHIYGNLIKNFPGTMTVIGTDSSCVFQVQDANSSFTLGYKNSRQFLETRGNIAMNSLVVTLKSLLTITLNSSNTSGLPIPSYFDVHIINGTATMNDNIILTRGATVTIDQGATANMNGKNLYVLATADDPGSQQTGNEKKDVHGVQFTTVERETMVDVNGTLKASGGFYTSSGKPPIISSGGSGVIEVTGTSDKASVLIKTGTNTSLSVPVTPAYLHNVSGTTQIRNDTFTYNGEIGKWQASTHDIAEWTEVPATCTTDGSKSGVCSICGETVVDVIPSPGHNMAVATCTEPATCQVEGCGYTEGEPHGHNWLAPTCTMPSVCTYSCGTVIDEPLGHSYDADEEVRVEPNCTEDGYIEQYCMECAYRPKEVLPALGHDSENDTDHICDRDSCDAVISNCKEKAAHTPAQAATCSASGNTEYWTCGVCGKYYSDVNCTAEIAENSWIIPIDETAHADEPKDHKCDYCEAVMGIHEDTNTDHACDYGCAEKIGEHNDTDKNHSCDYGCNEAIGIHEDSNLDHICDYGCTDAIGTCGDADKNHKCDYGCEKNYGDHTDGNLDHICDYGCSEKIGEHKDADKNHSCDYGCSEAIGICEDTNKNHSCDYGCSKTFGTHEDTFDDQNHVCDYCNSEEQLSECTPGAAVIENETAATCTAPGSYDSVIYCSECGVQMSRETVAIEKVAHSYEAVVTAPTCEAGGYTTYTCSACGDSYMDNYVDATGHNYSVEQSRTEATCVATGSVIKKCTNCDSTTTETLPINSDNHTDKNSTVNAKEADCVNAGYTGDTVCECGVTVATGTEIPAKGHTASAAVEENRVEASCTATGSYDSVVYCSACGSELSRENKTIAMVAHTPAEAVRENEVAATCYEEGSYEEVVYCSVEECKAEISRETKTVEKIAHTPAEAIRENEKAATCYAEGSYDEVIYCSVAECKHEISRTAQTIEKIAHTPAEAIRENEKAATCYAEGSYDEVVYCSVEECKHEISRTAHTIEKIAHTPAEVIRENEKAATCYAEGSYDEVIYCSICDAEVSRKTITVDALDHDWDDPTYNFAENGKGCTAERICKNDKTHIETAKAEITSAVKIPATCEDKGTTTYTATFVVEWAVNQTKDVVDIEAIGHEFEYFVGKSEDCGNDGHLSYEYCKNCDRYHDLYTGLWIFDLEAWKVGDGKIPATGEHSYYAVNFVWGDDNKTCSVEGACSCGHATKTVNAEVTTKVVKEPTCTSMGTTEYIAVVVDTEDNWSAGAQNKFVEDIPATGEHIYTTYVANGKGFETASCDYGCGTAHTRVEPELGEGDQVEVEIPEPEEGQTTTNVTLDTGVLADIKNKKVDLYLNSELLELVFNNTAVGVIADKHKDNQNVSIVVEDKTAPVPEGQQPTNLVFDIHLAVDGEKVEHSDFGTGSVTVTIPLDSFGDLTGKMVKVWYLSGDEPEEMEAIFDNNAKKVKFLTHHFSEYKIEVVDVETDDSVEVTFNDLTKDSATIDAPATGKVGEAYTFTVTCEKACVVLTKDANGEYTRLPASGDGNTRSFTVTLAEGMEIVVGIKGDADGNGVVGTSDYIAIARSLLPSDGSNQRYQALDALNKVLGDADGKNGIGTADYIAIARSLLPSDGSNNRYQSIAW